MPRAASLSSAAHRRMSAPCRDETEGYRACLKQQRESFRAGRCAAIQKKMEACREKWRQDNGITNRDFQTQRELPPAHCKAANEEVQKCLHQHEYVEGHCAAQIAALRTCMS